MTAVTTLMTEMATAMARHGGSDNNDNAKDHNRSNDDDMTHGTGMTMPAR